MNTLIFHVLCSQGIRFDLGAVTVDPQTPSYDPSPLKVYLAALGVPYFYESQCKLTQLLNVPANKTVVESVPSFLTLSP